MHKTQYNRMMRRGPRRKENNMYVVKMKRPNSGLFAKDALRVLCTNVLAIGCHRTGGKG